MIIPDNALVEFVSKIQVMKPVSIKEDNTKNIIKLNALYDSLDYVEENKIDGCHYLLFGNRFFSTEHVEKTENFPHLKAFFSSLGMFNLILDGEINYPGKTSQFCTRVTGSGSDIAISFQDEYSPIHYTIWDILRTPKGTWLINEPLYKRRQILEYWYNTYVKNSPLEEFIHLTDWIENDKRGYQEKVISSGGEGIILKNKNSLYVMGKKPAWMWIKVKVKDETDLFISGYEPAKVIYDGKDIEGWPYWLEVNNQLAPVTKYHYFNWIGALELSAYVNGVSTKICTCSGITEELRKQISENAQSFMGKVVKISFMEKTEKGIPRHPRFEQFHEGKNASECVWSFN